MVVHHDEGDIFVEAKTDTGYLSTSQQEWFDDHEDLNPIVLYPEIYEDFKALVY